MSLEQFGVVVGLLVLYGVHVAVYPWMRCIKCRGKGRFYGGWFGTFRLCPRCGGNGRETRWARRFVALFRPGLSR